MAHHPRQGPAGTPGGALSFHDGDARANAVGAVRAKRHTGTVDEHELHAPVPAAVRAQILATEHWSLLGTRSLTWSEVMSRITIHLTVTSASLVVLALVAQATGFGTGFQVMAIGLAASALVLEHSPACACSTRATTTPPSSSA